MPSDTFDDLENKLAQFAGIGNTILFGDMNARTLCQPDFIMEDDSEYVPVPPAELYMAQSDIGARENQDIGYNSYGPKFLELCKKVNLRILNGRTLGDLSGNLTCFTGRGFSTVDYAAVSPDILKFIRYFKVEPIMPIFSDHCPISLVLKVQANIFRKPINYTFLDKPDKLIWNKSGNQAFCEVLNSDENKSKIDFFLKNGVSPNQSSIDSSVEFINDLLINASTIAGMMLKKGIKPRKSSVKNRFVKVKPPKWHDKTCHEMFSSIKKTALLLSKDPKNAWLLGKIRTETKQYNKLLKSKQKEFINASFKELEKMHSTDPRAYMELVRALKDGSHDQIKPSDTDSIDAEEWFEHFKDLLGKTKEASEKDKDIEEYIRVNCDSLSSEFDQHFSKEELKKSNIQLKKQQKFII